MMNLSFQEGRTPLPTSPTRGEVPAGSFDSTVPHTPVHTSPRLGEAGRGVRLAPIPPMTSLNPRENF